MVIDKAVAELQSLGWMQKNAQPPLFPYEHI